jgi:hypothetical protein
VIQGIVAINVLEIMSLILASALTRRRDHGDQAGTAGTNTIGFAKTSRHPTADLAEVAFLSPGLPPQRRPGVRSCDSIP